MKQSLSKLAGMVRWLPSSVWRWSRAVPPPEGSHIVFAVADHFEPSFLPDNPSRHAPEDEQERRLDEWCRLYPKALDSLRDSDGRPWVHTYFFPAEQYRSSLVERLADHCREGWGEIEVHLHHGVERPDTSDATRRTLVTFRDRLAAHGCLSRTRESERPMYAFTHGNWALANSADGVACGVDDEMAILAETGCYVDMTLPAAPHPAQVRKTNAFYECGGPLGERAPHRSGRDLRVGVEPTTLPLIFQGPLGLFPRPGRWRPYIENGELTAKNPPTMARLRRWAGMNIGVVGRPDWTFVKLHCHGMDPRDRSAMLGEQAVSFLSSLITWAHRSGGPRIHFCSAREMFNIALAACDGRDGSPDDYRDYRLVRRQ